MIVDIEQLTTAWIEAKRAETDAVDRRREIEDQLVMAWGINPTVEGTVTHEVGGDLVPVRIKVATRLTRKVDADMAQEIAAEHGLQNYLSTLFRWKPEIDAKAWKAAPDEVTAKLNKAITTTAGRPSFSVTA